MQTNPDNRTRHLSARVSSAPTPSLAALDPRNLAVLRSEKLSGLKNTLMVSILESLDWFVQFRTSLHEYRHNNGPEPVYPHAAVERVERLVDQLIRDAVDPEYSR